MLITLSLACVALLRVNTLLCTAVHNRVMIRVAKHVAGGRDYLQAIAEIGQVGSCANSNQLLHQGYLLTKVGRYSEAIAALSQWVNKKHDSLGHFRLGTALWKLGSKERAYDHWRLAEAQPYFLCVANAQAETNPREAEIFFKIATNLAPDRPEALRDYGAFLYRQKQFSESYRQFQAAYRLSADPDLLVQMGVVLLAQQKPVQALQYFLKAYRARPEIGIYAVHVGDAHRAMDEKQSAIQWYLRALPLVPEYEPLPLRYLGETYLEIGRPQESIRYLRKALARVGTSPSHAALLHFRLAQAHLALADSPAALLELECSIQLDPRNAFYHLELGKCLIRLGQLERGCKELESAQVLSRTDENVKKEAQELLRNITPSCQRKN